MLNLTNYSMKCKLNNKKILFLSYRFGKDYEIWQGCEETDILIYCCWEYLAISINILNVHMLEYSNPTSRNFSYR